jgi:hypothetical protein
VSNRMEWSLVEEAAIVRHRGGRRTSQWRREGGGAVGTVARGVKQGWSQRGAWSRHDRFGPVVEEDRTNPKLIRSCGGGITSIA